MPWNITFNLLINNLFVLPRNDCEGKERCNDLFNDSLTDSFSSFFVFVNSVTIERPFNHFKYKIACAILASFQSKNQ